MNSLQTIFDSRVIDENNERLLKDLAAELRQTQDTVQRFRTRTEMLVSVLNQIKHPTADSKYWQAVREQNVHFEQLVLLSYDYRTNAVEIKQLERKLAAEQDDLEREMIQIEIDKKRFIGDQMARTAKDRIREICEWSSIKAELRPNLKYGDQDVNEHQLDSMRLRFDAEGQLVSEHTPPADARNIIGLRETSKIVKHSDVSTGVRHGALLQN